MMGFRLICLHSVLLRHQHRHHHRQSLAEVLAIRSQKCTHTKITFSGRPINRMTATRNGIMKHSFHTQCPPQNCSPNDVRAREWVCAVCVCLFGNDFVGKHINFWWSLLSPSRYLCPSHGRVRRHPKTLTFISSDVPKCLSTFVVVAVCQLINSENSIRHVLRLLSTEQSQAGDFQISHSNRTIGAC